MSAGRRRSSISRVRAANPRPGYAGSVVRQCHGRPADDEDVGDYAPPDELVTERSERPFKRAALAAQNVTRQADVDLCVAVIGGLIDAQLANDPGGDRWSRLLDRAIDMLADNLGVPARA
jgi:hypothetical protein